MLKSHPDIRHHQRRKRRIKGDRVLMACTHFFWYYVPRRSRLDPLLPRPGQRFVLKETHEDDRDGIGAGEAFLAEEREGISGCCGEDEGEMIERLVCWRPNCSC
jgi:hypothetical protein